MRFVHLSDTHLGYRQYNLEEREQDFYATWRQAIDKILQERPDLVVHSGDLFEDRRPPIQALVEARAGVRRLREAGIPFYYITGNHDQPTRAGALCPQAVLDEAIPLENRPLEKEGLYLAGVSYHSKLNAHLLRQQMAHHARRAATARWRVFALHQGIDRYVPEYELKFAELRDFHYYAAGHIHRRVADHSGQSLVAYPGSLDIWRIDEYDDWKKYGKGFYLVDLAGDEPEVQRLNVEVRPFLKGEITPETLEREVERLHQCAQGTVVYLDVYSPREDYARLARHIQEHLGQVALQVNLRPRAPDETPGAPLPAHLDPREILQRLLPEAAEEERLLALELYTLLASNNIEGAQETARRFLEKAHGTTPPEARTLAPYLEARL